MWCSTNPGRQPSCGYGPLVRSCLQTGSAQQAIDRHPKHMQGIKVSWAVAPADAATYHVVLPLVPKPVHVAGVVVPSHVYTLATLPAPRLHAGDGALAAHATVLIAPSVQQPPRVPQQTTKSTNPTPRKY